jgi:hypothetical protein
LLEIAISHANLQAALEATGAIDATITAGNAVQVPITIALSVGAQTYEFTEYFDYTAVKGVSGTGIYSLKDLDTPGKLAGAVAEGFFTVTLGTAIEIPLERAHFFQFNGFLSASNGVQLVKPPVGTNVVVTLNDAQQIALPYDRFKQTSPNSPIIYQKQNREIGTIRTLNIDPVRRYFQITTWDINSNANQGGSGLPVIGEAFTTFNFTLRLDLPQPNGTFSVVTATQLQRKSITDGLWQTGRKTKPQ